MGMEQPSGRRPERQVPWWVSLGATLTGAAITLLSFGTFTWAVVGAYALWRRSWRLAVAGVGYFILIASVVVLALRATENDEGSDAEAFYVVGVLGFCWIVGTVHVVLLSPAVWSALTKLLGAGDRRDTEKRRVRREQARYLLHYYPVARHELRIGRPDLPRNFDDGGLVDLNAVPEYVLAGLPGLTGEQRRQIAVDRWLRGPYASMEELAGRCPLPPATIDLLREVLLFLPPADYPARSS